MLAPCLEALRSQSPRIHCITNVVSAPLCANGLIAMGGAPIMADAPEEVGEITARCQGLSLNLGMPNQSKISAMMTAGLVANRQGIPVVFDPVGVGASGLRTATAQRLLTTIECTAIRGNLSEIKTLAGEEGHCLGVDAGESITEENVVQVVDFARKFACKTGSIIAISSVMDVVTDGQDAYVLANGHPLLSTLSGSGCLLSVLVSGFLASNEQAPLPSVVAAMCAMGVCGERAAKNSKGTGSFAVDLLDQLSQLTGQTLEQEGRYESI